MGKYPRWLWGFLAGAVIVGGLWEFFPLADASPLLATIPRRGGSFFGRDVPLTEAEKKVFGAAKVTKIIYEMRGQRFFFSAIDGTKNRNAVHDPLYCIRGRGAIVEKVEDVPVEGGTVRWLTLSENGKPRNALLWFSDGRTRFPSVVEYWVRTTLRRLTLGLSGPEPVSFNVQPLDGAPLDRQLILEEFLPRLGA